MIFCKPCIDRFLDIVGRKEAKEEMIFKGFLEMNLLVRHSFPKLDASLLHILTRLSYDRTQQC
jgi:hypothetical protein